MSNNEMQVQEKKKEFRTTIVKAQDQYMGMIAEQFYKHKIIFTEYQKTCVLNALSAINDVLKSKGISFADPGLDQSSLSGIMQTVAALKLNAGAQPREVYFQLRNEKQGDAWTKKVEMGIEGNGNDALLRNFGVDVEKVSNPWLVREMDDFEYPYHDGFDMAPPKWRPKGQGKCVRIVYAIKLKDGNAEFLIQEREDVKANLIAHIANTLMNETFGICKKRFDATPEQSEKISKKKKEIIDAAKGLSLDEILDNEELGRWISPAWTSPQSREQMIIRKMRNNAVKKYPKDFGSMFAASQYSQMDETYKEVQEEVDESTGEIIDITPQANEIPEKSSKSEEKATKPQGKITPPKIRPKPAQESDAADEYEDDDEVDYRQVILDEPGF